MTDRDPLVSMPSCPFCGDSERVGRDSIGAKDNKRGAYLCGSCWGVFTGSQDEWQQQRGVRERRKAKVAD
jgi:hypothetical protein